MRLKRVILFTAGFLILYIAFAWLFGNILIILLERHVIPDYPLENASLREILWHFKKELANQGQIVEIRVLDERGYDEKRDVSGIAGNGYLFLYSVSDVFDTHIKYQRNRVIISGVGTKERKERGKP